jgi:hypothetical protein
LARARLPLDILGYCLMPNHFHLLIRPQADGDLGRWVQCCSWPMPAVIIATNALAVACGRGGSRRSRSRTTTICGPCCVASNATYCVPIWWRGRRTGSGQACLVAFGVIPCDGTASLKFEINLVGTGKRAVVGWRSASAATLGGTRSTVWRRVMDAPDGQEVEATVKLAIEGKTPKRRLVNY